MHFGLTGIDCNERLSFVLECAKETLYCVFANGTVVSFKDKKWSVLIDSKNIESSDLKTSEISSVSDSSLSTYVSVKGRFSQCARKMSMGYINGTVSG